VIAYAVDRFRSNLKTACSFQKEESVLAHMLSEQAPGATLFVIDTGVLFPETLQTWKQFEDRFPTLQFEVIDATRPGAPWTQLNCCGQAKVDGLERALAGVDAWITGIRREQAPTRANARKLEVDEKRGIWKLNPLADWTDKDLWRYIFEHDLPYNPLHDQGYESIGCAPCTLPGSGREGRWAGEDKTECGLHV
jgi:phosphoadenosine phosphosulfate reductase